MKYGYARVSTKDQILDMQIDALKKAGCDKIFLEVAKGAKADRPEWTALLNEIQAGDTLVVWKLDRMGRSLPHLIKTVNELISNNNIHDKNTYPTICNQTCQLLLYRGRARCV